MYFDSLTIVSEGDPFVFDETAGEKSEVFGQTYTVHSLSEFEGASGTLSGKTLFLPVDESAYSIKFTITPEKFDSNLCIIAYTDQEQTGSSLIVYLNSRTIYLNNTTKTVSLAVGATHEVEVGFVGLNNGNTVYMFIKIDGVLVAWEIVESYGKTPGNILITPTRNTDSFILA